MQGSFGWFDYVHTDGAPVTLCDTWAVQVRYCGCELCIPTQQRPFPPYRLFRPVGCFHILSGYFPFSSPLVPVSLCLCHFLFLSHLPLLFLGSIHRPISRTTNGPTQMLVERCRDSQPRVCVSASVRTLRPPSDNQLLLLMFVCVSVCLYCLPVRQSICACPCVSL